MFPVLWVVLGVTIVASAVRARRSAAALRTGNLAVAALYLVAGALVNAYYLGRGDDYATFADGSYLAFVTDAWRSLVVPSHHVFIGLLIAFEAAVGVLVLLGGRRRTWGYVAAIGFHLALLSFGWGFYLWSVPMTAALVLLLRAHLTQQRAPASPAPDADRELQRA